MKNKTPIKFTTNLLKIIFSSLVLFSPSLWATDETSHYETEPAPILKETLGGNKGLYAQLSTTKNTIQSDEITQCH